MRAHLGRPDYSSMARAAIVGLKEHLGSPFTKRKSHCISLHFHEIGHVLMNIDVSLSLSLSLFCAVKKYIIATTTYSNADFDNRLMQKALIAGVKASRTVSWPRTAASTSWSANQK